MADKKEWKSSPFSQKQIIECHKADVRCLAPYLGGGLVTGSRDFSSKLFQHEDSNDKQSQLVESQNFIGPSNFVSSVCVGREKSGQVNIFVGCHDGIMYIYTLMESKPIKTKPIHSGAISAVAFRIINDVDCLVTGSWDSYIKWIKDDGEPTILGSHAGTVWDVAFVARNYILTAGADNYICKWNADDGHNEGTFYGHTEPVRALAVVDAHKFLSCANDCKIILWDIGGDILNTFEGHENFIYDIAIIREPLSVATNEERPKHRPWQFISVSEDKTIRRWDHESGQVQVIKLDVATIWSVACIENGDFIVGSSDGKIRVYSNCQN